MRLGDGTELSHQRMQAAVDWVWPYLPELLADAGVQAEFDAVVEQVFKAATLSTPPAPEPAGDPAAGRDGRHTPALAELLGDLQGVARDDPTASW